MIDSFREGYAGFYPSLKAAEERAFELQAEGQDHEGGGEPIPFWYVDRARN